MESHTVHFYQFEAFSAPCELHIDAPTPSVANDAATTVIKNAKRLEHLYSFFRDDSEIYALNHRTQDNHLLSDELSGLIQLSLFYTNITQGAFDIAMAGTLKEATKAFSIHEYTIQKERLSPYASSSHLHLEGNLLSFSNSTTKIDLGGIVKEYAVDQSILLLQSMGINAALVNFGGDLAAFGSCHNQPWRVGIQDPQNPESNLVEVDIHTMSLCTSGHSKRYTLIQEERISHIVIPIKKAESYSQVSILAPSTVDAGIWSTALLVNPTLILPTHMQLLKTVQ
ncbi:MAG: FAD:protein FMN transferase [Sulfuricurvum sp.]|nr:FAD:protein FMN transferase [Sulfuricurvum sp.]